MFFHRSVKDVVLINFITLGGSGGMLPHENLMFQPLRLFLVASEHSDGENLSVISTGSPLFQVKCCKDMGCVSYRAYNIIAQTFSSFMA